MRAAGQMTIFDLMAARDSVAEAAAAVDAAARKAAGNTEGQE